MKWLRNICPIGAIDVPILGRQGEPFGVPGQGALEPGEVFECPDDIAGTVGSPQIGEPGDADYEPAVEAAGLLAQTANFEIAADPTASDVVARKRSTKSETVAPSVESDGDK